MAGTRIYHDLETDGDGLVAVQGSWATNGNTAFDPNSREGEGWTVTRTGPGTATITLNERWAQLVTGQFGLQLNALADGTIQMGAVDLAARTIAVRYLVAGVGAEWPAANANNRVHFQLVLRKTSVPPRRG